jgi:hypothetical protein
MQLVLISFFSFGIHENKAVRQGHGIKGLCIKVQIANKVFQAEQSQHL